MGLFDFLKKKPPPVPVREQTESSLEDIHGYLLAQIQVRLEEGGYRVSPLPAPHSLQINDELELTLTVLDGNYHPFLIHVQAVTRHPRYFPQGIEVSLAGMGESKEAKVASAVDNYLTTIFPPLMDSLTDSHCPDLLSHAQGQEWVWQARLGEIVYQGPWHTRAPDNFLYLLLREKIVERLEDRTLNWLKIYLSRQPGGEVIGECLLNNVVWEEGFLILQEFADAWGQKGEFLAQKQFMVFRRCDFRI